MTCKRIIRHLEIVARNMVASGTMPWDEVNNVSNLREVGLVQQRSTVAIGDLGFYRRTSTTRKQKLIKLKAKKKKKPKKLEVHLPIGCSSVEVAAVSIGSVGIGIQV
jgi:hypothetical protein